ncbi:FxLD family lanthipeptide [Myceligenerans pegani]|uniref:FxLD family lanthipeptide n=1 Tax=Myceligenerans pegani TaxID=2776917 RepID=A0ABR9N1E9_9MICO|nr:FxLD family lanthipeptide [Myceligenerans sp. TRM 65318]MBE1877473.1 FxLD family lanthipeptide [Myceligenerans sp. TRM 65318]MBE3019744.1 FxLD family lanthipeptide [Myceligenerans sp. TRM 65318]
MSTITLSQPSTPEIAFDEWRVAFEIVDAPVAVPAACDSGDGCGTTCESACTSD